MTNPLERQIADLIADPMIGAMRVTLDTLAPNIVEETIRIQQIPAPTFDEGLRAAYVHARFLNAGLINVETDDLHNVYGCLRGSIPKRSPILISAHTDTVFPLDTPLDVENDGTRIQAPGIGDNSLGVAALLGALDVLKTQQLPADIWFVANSREEGMGDLGGIRGAYEYLTRQLGRNRLSAAIVIEGMALGRIYHSGIAVRRLQISCRGPGGHSWLHFGRPSAIHGLMRLGAQIAELHAPEVPRTTYNIGMIEGGRSVNSIADKATMLLDLRSENRDTLAMLEKSVMSLVEQNQDSELQFTVEVVGDRPAGMISRQHPLVQMAKAVIEHIGVTPLFETGSTDANLLLSQGLPTVTIGITNGGNAHRLDEFIEIAPIRDGVWQLILLALASAR